MIRSGYSNINESNGYDIFKGKKYWISASISNYPGELSDMADDVVTDNPKEAITAYFKLNKKFPTNTDISTKTRKNALELIKYASEHKEWIIEMMKKYNHHYKEDAFTREIDEQLAKGCRTFYESNYGDMIYPFDRG